MAPGAPLSSRALGRATLARQGLLSPIRATPADAVERLGSLQAQHPEWPPIALAVRAADRRTADLAAALGRREVVRSSLMRITIHVVTAADLWPMFTICQRMRLEQWRLLTKADPATSPLGRRVAAAHPVALAAMAERPRTSLELDRIMTAETGDIDGPVPRLAWRHLTAHVPLIHVPHDGERYGRSLYVAATDWLGVPRPVWELDEARRHLTRRYLAAFGPASVEDLVAYVGRGRGGLSAWRAAIEALGDSVISVRTRTVGRSSISPMGPGRLRTLSLLPGCLRAGTASSCRMHRDGAAASWTRRRAQPSSRRTPTFGPAS